MWYESGVLTSENYSFKDLPDDGALGLITFESELKPDGFYKRNIYKGYDYYFEAIGANGVIYGCDLDSRERCTRQDILKRYNKPVVIRGIWTDTDTMHKAIGQMNEWQLSTSSKQIPISQYKSDVQADH